MQVGEWMRFGNRRFCVVYTYAGGGKVKENPDDWDSPGFWIDKVNFEKYRERGDEVGKTDRSDLPGSASQGSARLQCQ